MMLMKAIVLAAGKGTRMRPLTYETPKPLIPINERPFLLYLIDNLKAAGIDELCIVVGYMKECVEGFCEINNIHATFVEQEELLGTGHAVSICRNFIKNESFVVVNGDNLYSKKDIASVKDCKTNCIAGISHDRPEKFGVLVQKDGFLLEIKEKPADFFGNTINTGIYKFTPEIFDALKEIKKSASGEYYLTDAVSLLAKKKKVRVHMLKDYWLDLGCYDDIAKVEDFITNNVSKRGGSK